MRIGVVGAGLAGLSAARELVADGHEVVIVEKSRGLGGRLASRRVGAAVLDHGSPATAAPPGSALRAAIDGLPAADRIETDDGVVHPSGATRLPKLMAEGLDVLLGVRLAALRAHSGGLELGDEQGNTHGVVDAVIVTAPAPQAADLLARSPEAGDRVAIAADAGVRARGDGPGRAAPGGCPTGAVRRPASGGRGGGAPRGGQGTAAARGRGGAGGPDGPRELARPARRLRRGGARRGRCPRWPRELGPAAADPAWVQVKRWRYAVPRGRLDDEVVNPPGSRIVVAGDTVTGATFGGRDQHRVAESGVAAARRVAGLLAVAP